MNNDHFILHLLPPTRLIALPNKQVRIAFQQITLYLINNGLFSQCHVISVSLPLSSVIKGAEHSHKNENSVVNIATNLLKNEIFRPLPRSFPADLDLCGS